MCPPETGGVGGRWSAPHNRLLRWELPRWTGPARGSQIGSGTGTPTRTREIRRAPHRPANLRQDRAAGGAGAPARTAALFSFFSDQPAALDEVRHLDRHDARGRFDRGRARAAVPPGARRAAGCPGTLAGAARADRRRIAAPGPVPGLVVPDAARHAGSLA